MKKHYTAPTSETIDIDTSSILAGSGPHVLEGDGDGESQVVNPGDEESSDGDAALSKKHLGWDEWN